METIVKTQNLGIKVEKTIAKIDQQSDFWSNVEKNRFGIIPITLVIIACLGGFAASFGAQGDTFKLALTAFPSIVSLALTLAVAPMRLIIWTSSIAVIFDILVFLL